MKVEIEAGCYIMIVDLPDDMEEDDIETAVTSYVHDMFCPARINFSWKKVGDK